MSKIDRMPVNCHKIMLEQIMFPFQKAWIEDALLHRRTLIMASRQIGKSFAAGWLAIVLASGYSAEDGKVLIPPHNVHIISADRERSKNIIAIINEHLDALELALGTKLRDPIEGGLERVVLLSGKTISSVAGDPRALQGMTGSVLVDELSITKYNPEDIFAQAMSVSSRYKYFRTIFFSNAAEEGSFIDRFLNGNSVKETQTRSKFCVHTCNIWEAYPNGLPEHIQELKDTMTFSNWERFYENKFVSGNLRLISESLISNIKIVTEVPKNTREIMIMDPGFTRNPTGIIKAAYDGRVLTITHAESMYGAPEDLQIERAIELGKHCSYVAIDQGTQGYLMAGKIVNRLGSRAEKISINQKSYDDGLNALLPMLREGRIQVLDSVETRGLLDDLLSLDQDSRGHVNVPEKKVQSGFVRHADEGVALLVAITRLEKLGSFQGSRITVLSDLMVNTGISRFI